MKRLSLRLAGVVALLYAAIPPVLGAATSTEDALLRVVQQYERAVLNQDAELAVDVFNEGGSWLAQGRPAAVGKENVRAALEELWKGVPQFSSFVIQPVDVDVIEDWAAIRADVFVNANPGIDTIPSTKALFVLRRKGQAWGIDHYMFNANSDGEED